MPTGPASGKIAVRRGCCRTGREIVQRVAEIPARLCGEREQKSPAPMGAAFVAMHLTRRSAHPTLPASLRGGRGADDALRRRIITALILFTGCALTYWTKAGATDEEFYQDSYECAVQASPPREAAPGVERLMGMSTGITGDGAAKPVS